MPTEELYFFGTPVLDTLSTRESPIAPWTPSTAYLAGDLVRPTTYTGWSFRTDADGLSGETEPTWPASAGLTVQDNEVLWVAESGVAAALAHGLAVGQRLRVDDAAGGTLPAPLVTDTDYFIREVVTASEFKVAATPGGTIISLTTLGSGWVLPYWIVEKPGLEEVPLDAMAVEEGVTGTGALLRKRLRFVGASISEEEISDKTIIDVTPVVSGYAHLGSANVFTVAPQTFQGAAVGTSVLETKVVGDPAARFRVNADGKHEWGDGGGTFDTNLYRSAADRLGTDNRFVVTRAAVGDFAYSAAVTGDTASRFAATAAGGLEWGPGGATARDTFLARTAAATLTLTGHLLPEASGTRDIGSTTFRVRDVHAQKVRLENALGDKVALWGTPGAAHYGFGVQAATLQQFVSLSTERHVWGYGYSGSLTEWMRLDTAKLGLGATSLLATFTVRASARPTIRLEAGDVTVADFSGVGFNPTWAANMIGQLAPFSPTTGGQGLLGFSSAGTNTGAPVTLGGYHGGTAPTTGAVQVYGYKHNGTTGRTALSGTEPVFTVTTGAGGSAVFSILGSGALLTTGALTHSGTTIGFFGVTPAVRASAYTATNVTTDRSYDANATTTDELADVLGTLIADLRTYGLVQ